MILMLLLAAVSCSLDDERAPTTLMDGSAARVVPVTLDGVEEPTVLTRARIVRVGKLERGSAAAECLGGRARGSWVSGVAVERMGVTSESVTLRETSGRALHACDDSPGDRDTDRRWCGGAYGVLIAGRLRDPRLSILCSTGDGTLLGFVWIQPGAATRYVAVEQSGFVEVYETAGGLPVRVSTTTHVDLEHSSAAFSVSEHDASGSLLRTYELRAVVAG
ncbi:MAG TPA: hypothetical protein VMN35_06280 [Gaiellaceae bacterium]|nr:hypothetical protein [Gaiellaceae bacterium]